MVRTVQAILVYVLSFSLAAGLSFGHGSLAQAQGTAGTSEAPQTSPPIHAIGRKKRARKQTKVVAPPPPIEKTEPTPVADTDIQGTIASIKIRGNKKIENDAVMARLVSKVGDAYSTAKIRQDVDALFKTGYFYDVQVDRTVHDKQIDLTYILLEKPSIIEIKFQGNSEVDTDDLKEPVGIKAFEILNMSKIREATEKLQKLYEDKGFFLAHVTPRIETVTEGESVRLIFEIQENEKVKVKRVTFLGNKNMPDGKIKGMMQTQEGGFFSFISDKGAYKQDAFDHDIQLINYLYFNEGYVKVKVDRPQIYVTPDRKSIYITIRIEEGDRFKVGTVDFAGDLLFERDELYATTSIQKAGWYKHETLLKDLRDLQAKYGDLGYAYANIIPRTRTRDADKEVDITFEIDKGNKVYFGKINVVGNTKTRDKVVRRELTIREGELYNETRKRESMENVKRLGFFEDVSFNSKTPADNPDLMDLDITVKERNTGTIQLGAGYSTYSAFNLNGQVNQTNLFGRGQRLGVSIDFSSLQSLFNINFTEPHLWDTDWSAGADAFETLRTLQEYTERKIGGATRFGHPLSKYLQGFVRYKLDQTRIDLIPGYGDPDLYPVATANGWTSSATFSLEYDKRDDRFAPTNGVFTSASIEYAGLGGDHHYTKAFASARYYKKAFWDMVWRNNLTYGIIHSNEPGTPVPYNELFLLGGANTLRGYDWYTVGRRVESKMRFDCLTSPSPNPACPARGGPLTPIEAYYQSLLPFGGEQEFVYQTEFEFPLITEAQVKGVIFYDVGYADDTLSITKLRSDWGFGFRWFSPIGPLRFEWGFPIARKTELNESAVNFQFAIGSPF